MKYHAATMSELFEQVVAGDADQEAFAQGDERLTFGQWLEAADSLASEWRSRGVVPGDVVAIGLPSGIRFAIAFLAGVRLGAVMTGLNGRLGPRELGVIHDRCAPTLTVVDDDAPIALPASARLYGSAALDAAVANRTSLNGPHRGREDDPLCIAWTSGTTGQPKGAWFDHRANRALAEMSGVLSGYRDRRLMPIPFAHIAFLTRVWDQASHAMTSVVPTGAWSAAEMLRVMHAERVTIGQAVPTQWAKLIELPELADADLSALRICGSGAAPVSTELVVKMRELLGCPVVVRYACTEAPIASGTLPDDAPEVLLRTVGRPAVGVEIELRDDDGRPVADGEVGTVHLRSPGTMSGYWDGGAKRPESPWVSPGDLGRFDGPNLVLCGRTSEMYIRGGYNIYPLEVQRVIEEMDGVAASSVVGVDAPVIGEIGVAFVVPEPGAAHGIDEQAVKGWVRARLADYKVPDRVVLVDQLPLTAMMKVDTRQLKQLAADSTHRG